MYEIDRIISQIDYLTPVAGTTQKILSIAEDPDSKISDLVDLIIYDQAMTANILKICNSAYFGLPKRINSLEQAISYLGKNQVSELVFMKSMVQNLRKGQKGYSLCEGELWKYSISSAIIAKELAKEFSIEDSSLIFTAALIKDIGKVILDKYVENSFKHIIGDVLKNGCTFIEAEKKIIGIDHAELGGLVAEKWNFSDKMVHIIRYHHLSEQRAAEDIETYIVYMADILCMMMGMGVGSDGLAYKFYKDVAEKLNLSENTLMDVMLGFMVNFKQVEDLASSLID
jgi:putative nucleotidyltransferase with HDIG domain